MALEVRLGLSITGFWSVLGLSCPVKTVWPRGHRDAINGLFVALKGLTFYTWATYLSICPVIYLLNVQKI